MKRFKCSDVGFNCNYEITGSSDDEILKKAGEHMRNHNDKPMSRDDESKIRKMIKNV
jgi:predicted small metal-binding protein